MSGEGAEAARAEYLARVRARLVARREGVDPVTPPSRVTAPTLSIAPSVVQRESNPENVPADPVAPASPVRQPSPYSESDRPGLHELASVVRELGDDEVRVVAFLARRLLAGQRAYGKVDLARDPRDWRKERSEEVADVLVYSAFAELTAVLRGEAGR